MYLYFFLKGSLFHRKSDATIIKCFDTTEELCEIDAVLIKIVSAKKPGYFHGLNDTPRFSGAGSATAAAAVATASNL